MSRRSIPLSEVKSRLESVHGNTLTICDDTYKGTKYKAKFVDKDFGLWEAYVSNVLRGHCHPDRSKLNIKSTCEKKYGCSSPLSAGSKRDEFVKAHFQRWGVENPMQREDVKKKLRETMIRRFGNDNPQRVPCLKKKSDMSKRRTTILTHWKTGDDVVAVGSYEVATVKWLNDTKTDYDWQIPFVVSDSGSGNLAVGKTYFVDLKITSGDLKGMYVEIKGAWIRDTQKMKWDWFHSEHPNDSQLWTLDVLKKKGIL